MLYSPRDHTCTAKESLLFAQHEPLNKIFRFEIGGVDKDLPRMSIAESLLSLFGWSHMGVKTKALVNLSRDFNEFSRKS